MPLRVTAATAAAIISFSVLIVASALRASPCESDRSTLEDFFASGSGDGWAVHTGWNTSADVCTWFGIVCDTQSECVTEINLHDSGFQGSIPWSIGGLTYLTVLYVGECTCANLS